MDNHKSHSAIIIRELLEDQVIEALYLPANGSFLNPIERYWAYFKKALSRIYMDMNGTQESDQVGTYIKQAVEIVKDTADNLKKGPFKAMMSVYDEDSFRKVEARKLNGGGLVASP